MYPTNIMCAKHDKAVLEKKRQEALRQAFTLFVATKKTEREREKGGGKKKIRGKERRGKRKRKGGKKAGDEKKKKKQHEAFLKKHFP